ncbi:EscU/YscU/HrcU family type III secretion system export apparatus switch protein [Flavisphingomonas formosensis]|uniref:EscU/YscU/HrcU family type III secretion system export apparatus switch protein n=1 Tax=Flavisphingomonas formosensis TaxID=861534 RepID=UPI0012F70E37|nr:EscU/YscU/HrcU family type III secretion system export apparatus switch protein [Sphingomonas formosensis]
MEETEQDKSEAATPFKLDQARRKGTVARGMDLGFLTGLATFLAYMWMTGPALWASLSEMMRRALVSAPGLADDPHAAAAAAGMLVQMIWRPVAALAGAVLLVVLLFEILQTGIVFSSQPLKPDFNRLNPIQGLKRLFTFKLLIETAKNALKLFVYALVGWLVIRWAVRNRADEALGLGLLLARTGLRLLAAFALTAIFFAVLDQIINRRAFAKRMRMSRREVKREARDREGEPRLKQKRKQLHAEFVKMSTSLRAIRDADVLIVNPRHVAVALRYDPRQMAAPQVVSLGTDRLALRLKRLAFLYGIPVVEDRELARALLKGSALGRPIPEANFRPVAAVYNRLQKQGRF